MPNTMTSTDLAVKIRSLGVAAEKAQRKAVGDAALMVKRAIERETVIATKGSMGYSNMGSVSTRNGRMKKIPKGNARLSVGYDIVGERRPTALLVARGPWGIIEYGSNPHVITAKVAALGRKGVTKRMRRQRELDIVYGAVGLYSGVPPLAAPAGGGRPVYKVAHPGQKPRKPFRKGLERSRDAAARRATSVISNAVIDTVRSGRQTYTYIRGEVGLVKKGSI